ncbi:hypothetical protein F7725_007283 [Dissostichus mawsoni]|uniref:Uncharacterized protein n=1 Tax=Dissostichus mawsoni TaxID=36200 RepID=A0A7J5XX05_DISMA|nr:hypothetical protein F7725_007283 [Dissostichus mawsoni]
MLMARDTARDEAQKLHRKWLKHQAFMAELARNKEWLAKIEQIPNMLCFQDRAPFHPHRMFSMPSASVKLR